MWRKICVSGLNVTDVPRRSVTPVCLNSLYTSPRRYSWWKTLPLRQISSLSHSLSPFTTETPTPWRPPDTL